jgi:protein-tyrosine phosphatase
MPTNIYWLHSFDNGAKLGIMARPRGGDWLEGEVAHLKNSKVAILVSLLESDEIFELELDLEKDLCLSQEVNYLSFPIHDRSIPKSRRQTDQLIDMLSRNLDEGHTTVIHCRMGIGRSSIIAAAILLTYGFKTSEIIERINYIRGLKVPDTDEQLAWLIARE